MANGQKKPRRVPSRQELHYRTTLSLGGAIIRSGGQANTSHKIKTPGGGTIVLQNVSPHPPHSALPVEPAEEAEKAKITGTGD